MKTAEPQQYTISEQGLEQLLRLSREIIALTGSQPTQQQPPVQIAAALLTARLAHILAHGHYPEDWDDD